MKIFKYSYRTNIRTVFLCTMSFILLFQTTEIWSQKPYEGKVILAVFAHPDDESTVSPILAKYVREGAQVHLVIVTDGRYGTNDYHDHEAGETLVATRKEEMKCAAEKLGVVLTHLDYHDQLRAGEGYDGHMPQAWEMIKELYGIIEKVQPDVLITWGPDGGTTHMDHRLVGASVTQVFLSKDWDKPMSLFFYGTPSENIDSAENKILRGQSSTYLRTKISYTQEDLNRGYTSIQCHYSQMDPDMTQEDYEKGKTSNGMFVYLRKFEGPTKDSNSVFE
ncbi:MAG: LmbE family N-acetylglucosaminyl deacetylase [Maribacter sp.]|jgi:LmbE family N-acetylglucosaminyl deacetylase